MLEAIGLDASEEEAYRLLLGLGDLRAQDLAAEQGISTRSAHTRLERLVAAGLAVAGGERPEVFRPIDPRSGLSALIRTRQADLERASAAVESYAAAYHDQMLRSETRRLVEVIEGRGAISEQFAGLMGAAEHEVLAFDTPPYVSASPNSSVLEREVLARGVSVRAVYASEVIASDDRAENVAELTRLGEQARVVRRVPLKMVVVDARVALIPMTASPEGTRSTAIVVQQSRLCDALVELFDATWERGTPIFATASRQTGDLDPIDSALLSLLNAGLKDEAVARQLELSERTVRRRVADLVDRLGASSRFQAGAQAVRRGWLA